MIERVNVLGVGVSAVNLDITVATIADWIGSRERHYVCVSGVHGVMESRRDERLRAMHNRASLVTPDGMPLAWLLKLAGHRHADRVYGPDLLPAVVAHGQDRGHRHFFYGATAETLRRLTAALLKRSPDARIVGVLAPPFRPMTAEEDRAAVAAINDSGADIVWVGLSTPKQERWMAEHRAVLQASVLIGVGAAFDFHAGTLRQAPRFIQRSGLEWAFRLAVEPRRLWRRYLRNNPQFLVEIVMQRSGLREFRMEQEG